MWSRFPHSCVLLIISHLLQSQAVDLPYIRLRDNLGEPQQRGFGLDLKGFQSTVQFTDMQVHSLKPSGGTDMQFLYQDGLIRGFGDAAGRCVSVRDIEHGSAIDCPPCNPDDPRQRWQLDGHGGEEGTLVVEAFPKLCLAAGDQMVEAGPFVKRQLYVEICMVVQEEFRIWDIV